MALDEAYGSPAATSDSKAGTNSVGKLESLLAAMPEKEDAAEREEAPGHEVEAKPSQQQAGVCQTMSTLTRTNGKT